MVLSELSQAQGQDLDVVRVDFGLLARLSQVGSVLCALLLVVSFELAGLAALLLGLGLLPGVVEYLLELGGVGGPVEGGPRNLSFGAQVLDVELAVGVLGRPACSRSRAAWSLECRDGLVIGLCRPSRCRIG